MGVDGAVIDRVRGRLRGRCRPPLPGRILDLASARVHVQVRGGGETVVYIPDPPNGLDSVDRFLRILEADHRVVAFELPGFGWSRAKPGYGFSMWDHAGVLHEVLEATNTERVVLVAPCLTGFVALAYAYAHPERVAGLVLPQVPDWTHAQHWVDRVDRRGTLRRPWSGQVLTALAEGAIAMKWYKTAEPDAAQREEFIEAYRSRGKEGRLFSLATALQSMNAPDPFAGRPPIEVPTLLPWGDADPSHPPGHAHTLTPMLKRAQTETLKAGHFPELTHPRQIVRWIDGITVQSA